MTAQPRGIRNNNPGNIRKSTDRWRGLAEKQTDPEFFQFVSPVLGIRAMAIILLKYQRIHGLRTPQSIINRWAPPKGDSNGPLPGGEYTQNSKSYARAIANTLNIQPTDEINLSHISTLYAVIVTMIRHENGIQPYGRDIIMQAINMAGVR